MKAVILAGGYGTRISEETQIKPKPLVEIGGRPILWHIMKAYSHYGINDFIICCGYKGYKIKEYFTNYFLHNSDITVDLKSNHVDIHQNPSEPWKVTLVDTGLDTMTGGRLKRVEKYVGNETFCFTYGDGVSDVNISELVEFHQKNKKSATVTSIQPPGRYGNLELKDNLVSKFIEKPQGDGGWVNGGFFVLEHDIFNYIDDDKTIWEKDSLEKLSENNQLVAFKHNGFWQPLDTLRDKNNLEKLWVSNKASWKVWQ